MTAVDALWPTFLFASQVSQVIFFYLDQDEHSREKNIYTRIFLFDDDKINMTMEPEKIIKIYGMMYRGR